MSGEIINRVAKSGLINIDLEDYAPQQKILEFDIKELLLSGIVLKEKEFRNCLKQYNFNTYQDSIVALFCSTDAIIPMWSYMLISSYLTPVCSQLYFGNKEEVREILMLENINAIKIDKYKNKKVIIKGCGNLSLKESLYVAITKKLQNTVSSLMFGEACSAVPVYKKKK